MPPSPLVISRFIEVSSPSYWRILNAVPKVGDENVKRPLLTVLMKVEVPLSLAAVIVIELSRCPPAILILFRKTVCVRGSGCGSSDE